MSETTQFRVLDLDCPTCASTVERSLESTAGVEDVEVHYTTGRVEVTHEPERVTRADLSAAIQRQGYTPQET